MEGMIDIHSHVLPGIDDGPSNMEQSLDLLRVAMQEGITEIIVTPHYRDRSRSQFLSNVNETIDKLKEQMSHWNTKIGLYIGCEIYYSESCIEGLKDKSLPTLANSRYVLIEYSPMADYNYIRESVLRLLSEGYLPIIAHIERYICMSDLIKGDIK